MVIASCLTSLSSAQDRRTDRSEPRTTYPPAANVLPSTATSVNLTEGVLIASIDAEDRSLRRYAGQKLMNTQGGELGTIRDFIVHPQSSRVQYVVVSSGGILGGMGNSLRLVPVEAVRHTPLRNTFEVDILQADWLQIPPVSDENYVIDRFDLSAAQHQQMVQRFGAAHRSDRPATVAASPSPQNEVSGLIRASAVRGKAVHVAGRKVGDIENIILDLDRGTAAALLDASGDFTGTTAKYLVPLSRLVFDFPRQDPIGTTLTRADFDRAKPSSFEGSGAVAAQRIQSTTDAPLAPTGRTTAPANSNQPGDALTASARAVRSAIDNDPALVAERVQVTAENGRIVLSGSVRNEITKQNIENAARRTIPSGSIVNRITVENR
jgi:sporulation protein YlmC with PRC-barrel domain